METRILNFSRYTAAWSDNVRRAALERLESSVASWADANRRELEAILGDFFGEPLTPQNLAQFRIAALEIPATWPSDQRPTVLESLVEALESVVLALESWPIANSLASSVVEWACDCHHELEAILHEFREVFSAAETVQLRREAHARLAAVDVEEDLDLSGGYTPHDDDLPEDWYEIKCRVEALHRAPPIRRHSRYYRASSPG